MEKIMITIESVSRFRWNAELGAKLKLRRTSDKLSRATLAERVAAAIELPEEKTVSKLRAESFSTKYLEMLEKGVPNSVALESLKAIAEALGIGVDELLSAEDTIRIIYRENA
jgi:transcriptional regulator with XRE-family HTH domain